MARGVSCFSLESSRRWGGPKATWGPREQRSGMKWEPLHCQICQVHSRAGAWDKDEVGMKQVWNRSAREDGAFNGGCVGGKADFLWIPGLPGRRGWISSLRYPWTVEKTALKLSREVTAKEDTGTFSSSSSSRSKEQSLFQTECLTSDIFHITCRWASTARSPVVFTSLHLREKCHSPHLPRPRLPSNQCDKEPPLDNNRFKG